MRVVLVGVGSIGRRHLANIRALEPEAEIIVVRHARRDEVLPNEANAVVYTLEEALSLRPDIGFVCGPPSAHLQAGMALANAGANLFVEKPLAAEVEDAQTLVDAAARAGRFLIVGYNLRFLPSLRALRDALQGGEIGRPMSIRAEVGQYLPDWRPGTDYRSGNSARAAFGARIELELSHEIDYARWLLGEARNIYATFAKTSDLEIEVDDTAELVLQFECGALASLHMDMAQRSPVRTCRIAGTDGTLTWDAIAGEVKRYRQAEGWVTIHAGDGDRNAMYLEEARNVFACARGTAEPLVNGSDGLRTVQIAEASRISACEGRRVAI